MSVHSEELLLSIHGAGQSPTTLGRSTNTGPTILTQYSANSYQIHVQNTPLESPSYICKAVSSRYATLMKNVHKNEHFQQQQQQHTHDLCREPCLHSFQLQFV